MGMFSWMCKGGCGHPIKVGEDCIEVRGGEYGGYGDVGTEGEHSGCIYHKVCFFKQFGDIDTSEGDYDPNQGMGYPHPDFVPEGTTLYDERYECLKGAEKVGVLIDVSGGSVDMAHDIIVGSSDILAGAEQAMHYLGTEEVEVIAFDYNVVKQATVPADELYRLRYEPGDWFKGGGGTDVTSAFKAALDAGCKALIVLSDLYMTFPDDPGVPVIWMGLYPMAQFESNLEASREAYDGLLKPPYGMLMPVVVYPMSLD